MGPLPPSGQNRTQYTFAGQCGQNVKHAHPPSQQAHV